LLHADLSNSLREDFSGNKIAIDKPCCWQLSAGEIGMATNILLSATLQGW